MLGPRDNGGQQQALRGASHMCIPSVGVLSWRTLQQSILILPDHGKAESGMAYKNVENCLNFSLKGQHLVISVRLFLILLIY